MVELLVLPPKTQKLIDILTAELQKTEIVSNSISFLSSTSDKALKSMNES